MNIDGYVLLRINDKDEFKAEVEDLVWVDYKLERADFDTDYIAEQVANQLPKGMKDVLVMCFIKYESEECGNPLDGIDYEDVFNLVSHTVVKMNFKEFFRKRVTDELNEDIGGFKNIASIPPNAHHLGTNYYRNLVGEWEEFYDEDFIPVEEQKKVERMKWFDGF